MLERPCPRRRFHPVKAQVSQQLWTEVNLSASPTSPPHSHSRPVSGFCECVCVCVHMWVSVRKGEGTWRRPGCFLTRLRTLFLLWVRSSRTSLPSFLLLLCPLPRPPFLQLSPHGRTDSEVAEEPQHREERRGHEHGMPSDSSETVRVFVNSTCFTATLAVVLCLLTVHSRNLPSLYNALLQQSLCNLQIYFLYHSSPAMFWDRDCIDRVNIWTVVLYFLRVCSPLPLFLTLVTNFSLCQLA